MIVAILLIFQLIIIVFRSNSVTIILLRSTFVSLKYLSNFLRTLEMTLTNCEIILLLTWSESSFLVTCTAANQVPTFTVTDAKLYVPGVTLSTQNNVKLLKQL